MLVTNGNFEVEPAKIIHIVVAKEEPYYNFDIVIFLATSFVVKGPSNQRA
jgi:hypothetical protein